MTNRTVPWRHPRVRIGAIEAGPIASNADIVKAMYEAYNAGDHAAAIDFLDTEVKWDFTDAPDGVVYNGHDEVLAFWAMLGQVWESMKIEVMSQEEQGDTVTNEVRAIGRGLGSGVEVDQAETHVWRIRDGRLVEGKAYIKQGRVSSA